MWTLNKLLNYSRRHNLGHFLVWIWHKSRIDIQIQPGPILRFLAATYNSKLRIQHEAQKILLEYWQRGNFWPMCHICLLCSLFISQLAGHKLFGLKHAQVSFR